MKERNGFIVLKVNLILSFLSKFDFNFPVCLSACVSPHLLSASLFIILSVSFSFSLPFSLYLSLSLFFFPLSFVSLFLSSSLSPTLFVILTFYYNIFPFPFKGVTAVIFVAAISEYDQKLFEDASTNRMVRTHTKTLVTIFFNMCFFLSYFFYLPSFLPSILFLFLSVISYSYTNKNDIICCSYFLLACLSFSLFYFSYTIISFVYVTLYFQFIQI